jgi:tetratricopeptide (TPR) repeat protein
MTRLILVILLLATFAASAFAGDPKRAAVHNKQAKAYFDAKQFDEAILEFKKSYDLDPKPLTLYKIASAYYAKGDYKGAIEHYQKYLTADPDGPFAPQAIEFSTIANKALADEAAKQQAATEAARLEAERKAADAETERKRLAATARIKQAEAYAQASAWVSAGQEYTAATEVDGDPAHLLAAAEAFRKAPDESKARAAYLAYLDKVPVGPRSDEIRGKVAELSRSIEKAEADERERQRKLQEATGRPVVIEAPKKPPRKTSKRGWIVVGGTLLLTGLVADLVPPNGDNGKLDGSDFVAPVLYLLGAGAVLRGVF